MNYYLKIQTKLLTIITTKNINSNPVTTTSAAGPYPQCPRVNPLYTHTLPPLDNSIFFHVKFQLNLYTHFPWNAKNCQTLQKCDIYPIFKFGGYCTYSIPNHGQIEHEGVDPWSNFNVVAIQAEKCWKLQYLLNSKFGGSCTHPFPDQGQIWHARIDRWSIL